MVHVPMRTGVSATSRFPPAFVPAQPWCPRSSAYGSSNCVAVPMGRRRTYLGHTNISGTQAYLTMTPELLPEASKCFARYAAIDNTEENDNV